MSHSYKKHPVYKDNSSSNIGKKFANKKWRKDKSEEVPSKGGYKKHYEQYDIHDWICFWPKEEAIAEWEKEEKELQNGVYKYPDSSYHVKYNNDIERYLWDIWGKNCYRK